MVCHNWSDLSKNSWPLDIYWNSDSMYYYDKKTNPEKIYEMVI